MESTVICADASGALVLSAHLAPLFGFLETAVLMAVVNVGPAALAARETQVW